MICACANSASLVLILCCMAAVPIGVVAEFSCLYFMSIGPSLDDAGTVLLKELVNS